MQNKRQYFPQRLKMLGFLTLLLIVGSLAETPMVRTEAYATTSTATSSFQPLGTARGQGNILNSMVGPGNSASNQLFYLNYVYFNGTGDLVTIDPNTGGYHAYPFPASSEQGAWALTVGPDKNMYLGTLPNAHLMEFNTSSQQLIDLGRVPPDPQTATAQVYIWQLTVSPHTHRIYGCTFPSADLISYDPSAATPGIVNLGTMDPTGAQQYARTCTADPDPNSPYIYVGLGSVSSSVVAYNTDTKAITPLINSSNASFGWVYTAKDGHPYSYIYGCSPCQYYQLKSGNASQVNAYQPPAPTNVLQSGGTITVSTSTITVTSPGKQTVTYPYAYSRPLPIFRVGLAPSGKVEGDTVLPDNFFSFDPASPNTGVQMLGYIGDGETYSLLPYNQKLYMSGYSLTPLEVYDPSKPFSTNTNPLPNPLGNLPHDLRTVAMVSASDNKIYMGSYGSYGKLTGPLLRWDTSTNGVQQFFPVQNQGVSSLAMSTGKCKDSQASYCLIGGTTIFGGGGTTPATTMAQLFSWDPTTNSVVHTYTIPNVDKPPLIDDLITDPSTGYVYGITTNQNYSYVFVFNPVTGKFINGGTKLPFYSTLYNSVGIYKGAIWGLTAQGIFSINLNNVSKASLIPSSQPITAGFVMSGNTIYFASTSNLWSFTIA